MKLGAGYPMGPFELLDYTGLDLHKVLPRPSCKISLAMLSAESHVNIVTNDHRINIELDILS
jgi:3-hydroxyacyl-CoA dehydrogenase